MAPVVKHATVEEFQKQYGSLWNAACAYFDGTMTAGQAAGFELVAKADFLAAVAQTRLLEQLVDAVTRTTIAEDMRRSRAAVEARK